MHYLLINESYGTSKSMISVGTQTVILMNSVQGRCVEHALLGTKIYVGKVEKCKR